jgi:hypothetical protein
MMRCEECDRNKSVYICTIVVIVSAKNVMKYIKLMKQDAGIVVFNSRKRKDS